MHLFITLFPAHFFTCNKVTMGEIELQVVFVVVILVAKFQVEIVRKE
jgi:hypothetical protein